MWVVQVSSERQSARNGVHEFQYLDFFVIFALAADRSFQYRSFFVTGGQPADADTMSANKPERQSTSSLTPTPPISYAQIIRCMGALHKWPEKPEGANSRIWAYSRICQRSYFSDTPFLWALA